MTGNTIGVLINMLKKPSLLIRYITEQEKTLKRVEFQIFNISSYDHMISVNSIASGIHCSNASKQQNDEKAGTFEMNACTSHAPKVISYAKMWTSFLQYIL